MAFVGHKDEPFWRPFGISKRGWPEPETSDSPRLQGLVGQLEAVLELSQLEGLKRIDLDLSAPETCTWNPKAPPCSEEPIALGCVGSVLIRR